MASTPKRRRRNKAASNPPTETQPQSGLMSHEDMETMIRTCMASIIPTIEDTFRRYMDEYHHVENNPSSSIPMQTATSQQQSADTQQASSQAVTPYHSLLQEITSQGEIIQSPLSTYGHRANSSSSSISADLTETANFLVRNSLSESTLSAYKSAYLTYNFFIEQSFQYNASPLPPYVHHLSTFIAHCYLKGFAASTTSTLVSSLSFILQLGNSTDITQHFSIRKMLQGFRKSKPSSDSRLPITPTILKKIIHALEFSTTSAFTKSLFRAMFTLALSTFLRVGELTKTNAPTQHFLLFGNITLGSDSPCNRYIDINIPHFKHSKANTTTLRLQQNTTDPLVCPCQALLHYLNLRKHSSPSEPLFSLMDGSPISRQYFTQQLRSALAFCNFGLASLQS
ncbi:uncharacterized protein LOC128170937 [Crassostrea angulata]|uniref:uncharacterized protein LOC128170937 n=1 Tax=Magallana angulata TaxID=2784310 RepID=UPI0022B1C0FF|nr:uncharacterized protein LOC128170933 isoform X2 [Crassostrea angulata]XP_052692677.1 uncharacterized protein LOC128170937 [Crassostrea angulata]